MAHDDPFGTTGPASGDPAELNPLAQQVISVLCDRQSTSPAGARKVVLDYLVRAIAASPDFDVYCVLDELRGFRLTVDTIIDLYIPQTAVRLGALWETSEIDFAAVTIGALRLQSLLGAASGEMSADRRSGEDLLALVVVPEGEQHILGASVVAAQLRRLGCDVSVSYCETSGHIARRVAADRPDMVLMSCARGAGLATIARTVKRIRQKNENADLAPVIALGGAVRGDLDGIRQQTGVDLVTSTAKDVVSFCTKRRKALKQG